MELCFLFLLSLLPSELPSATWTFSWRRWDHLNWSIWREVTNGRIANSTGRELTHYQDKRAELEIWIQDLTDDIEKVRCLQFELWTINGRRHVSDRGGWRVSAKRWLLWSDARLLLRVAFYCNIPPESHIGLQLWLTCTYRAGPDWEPGSKFVFGKARARMLFERVDGRLEAATCHKLRNDHLLLKRLHIIGHIIDIRNRIWCEWLVFGQK